MPATDQTNPVSAQHEANATPDALITMNVIRFLSERASRGEVVPLDKAQCVPGLALIAENTAPGSIILLSEGAVKIVHLSNEGTEIILAIKQAPVLLGLAAGLLQIPHAYAAVAINQTRASRIDSSWFRCLSEDAQVLRDVLHLVCIELSETTERLLELACLSARVRLEYLLSDIIATQRGPRVQLPLREWEIAQYLGISPEHLCRLLRELERENLVRRDRGWIVLPDPRAIRCRHKISGRVPLNQHCAADS